MNLLATVALGDHGSVSRTGVSALSKNLGSRGIHSGSLLRHYSAKDC